MVWRRFLPADSRCFKLKIPVEQTDEKRIIGVARTYVRDLKKKGVTDEKMVRVPFKAQRIILEAHDELLRRNGLLEEQLRSMQALNEVRKNRDAARIFILTRAIAKVTDMFTRCNANDQLLWWAKQGVVESAGRYIRQYWGSEKSYHREKTWLLEAMGIIDEAQAERESETGFVHDHQQPPSTRAMRRTGIKLADLVPPLP